MMTTADWALVISLLSALISLAGFVWNVWSKFIYPKPKIAVSFSLMTIVAPGSGLRTDDRVLSLTATNMGPAEVTLHSALSLGPRIKWWSRRRQIGIMNPLHDYPARKNHTIGPFSGGLPKKLSVGESFTAYLVPDHEEIAKGETIRLGFHDTFGRNHWCKKADVIKALPRIREECDKSGKTYSKESLAGRAFS
jgi:hypothetical protein